MELFSDMERFMKGCDIMVLEVSKHSVSMGYMIMKVLSMKKPVIALYTRKNSPTFLVGIEDENFQLIEYEPNSLEKAIKNASDVGDIRFNMMFSPKLSTYLKEASKTESVSKATFIRRLIKKHQNKQE